MLNIINVPFVCVSSSMCCCVVLLLLLLFYSGGDFKSAEILDGCCTNFREDHFWICFQYTTNPYFYILNNTGEEP